MSFVFDVRESAMSGSVVKELRNLFDEKMKCMVKGMEETLEKISPNFTQTRLSKSSVYADPKHDYDNYDTQYDMLIGVAFAKEKGSTVVVLGYEFDKDENPTQVIFHELPASFTGRIYQLPASLQGESRISWADFLKSYMPSRIKKGLIVVMGSISEEVRSAIISQPVESVSQEKNTAEPKQKKVANKKRDKNYVARKGEDSGTGSEGELCESDKEIAGQTASAAQKSGQTKPAEKKQGASKTSKKRPRPSQAEHGEVVTAVATPISEHQLLAKAIKDWPSHLTTNPETLVGVGYMLFGPDRIYRAMRLLDERMRKSVMDEHGRARVAFEFEDGCYYTIMKNTEACMCLAGYIPFTKEMFQPGGCFDQPIVQVLERSEVEAQKRRVKDDEEASTSTTFKTNFVPMFPCRDGDKVVSFDVGVIDEPYNLEEGFVGIKMVIGFNLEETYWIQRGGIRTYEGYCNDDKFTAEEILNLITYPQDVSIRYASEQLLERIIIPKEGNRTLREVLVRKNAKLFVDLINGLTKDWKKFGDIMHSKKSDGHEMSVVPDYVPRGECVEDQIPPLVQEEQQCIYASDDPERHRRNMKFYSLGCFQALSQNPTNPVIFKPGDLTREQKRRARGQLRQKSRMPIQVTVKKQKLNSQDDPDEDLFAQFKETVHSLQFFPKIEKQNVDLLLIPAAFICEHSHIKKDLTPRHQRPWYECKLTGNFIHNRSCSECFQNPFANPFLGPLCVEYNSGACKRHVQNKVLPATVLSLLEKPQCGKASSHAASAMCMDTGLLSMKQQAAVFVGASERQEKILCEVEVALEEFRKSRFNILETKTNAVWKFLKDHADEQERAKKEKFTPKRYTEVADEDDLCDDL